MKNKLDTAQRKLVKRAMDARKKAYAPYSKFLVGAAIETSDGKIFDGCNIEFDSSGCCAERTALIKAVSEGKRKFKRIAVVGPRAEPSSPCGICRQALIEFADDMEVIMATTRGKTKVVRLKDLLPEPFHSLR